MDSDDVRRGSDLGLPYGDLRLIDAPGVGRLYDADDPILERPLRVRIGSGPDIPILRRAFSHWRDVGTHRNVVSVFDINPNSDGSVVALEMARWAESLDDRLATHRLRLAEVLALGFGLSNGLVAIHRARRVHGGITGRTIVLTDHHEPQFVDLGFAAAEVPGPADFQEDVAAVGRVLIAALGAEVVTGADGVALLRVAGSDPVPARVAAVLLTATTTTSQNAAGLLGDFRGLCKEYIGFVPGAIEGRSGIADDRSDRFHSSDEHSSLDESHVTRTAPNVVDDVIGPVPSWPSDDPGHLVVPLDDSSSLEIPPAPAPPPDPSRRPLQPLAVLAAVVAALLVGWGVSRLLSPAPPAAADFRDDLGTPPIVPPFDPSSISPGIAPHPGAPTDVRLTVRPKGRVDLEWVDNAANEAGYTVAFAVFEVDFVAGGVLPKPIKTGWLGPNVLATTAAAVDAFPPDQVDASWNVRFGTVVCLRPIAVIGNSTAPSPEQVCSPLAAPSAPSGVELATETTADRRPVLRWTDTSLDEAGFAVLSLDPTGATVVRRVWTDADVTSVVIAIEPGEHRCFVVRAENARNAVEKPHGRPTPHDASTTPVTCVDGLPRG